MSDLVPCRIDRETAAQFVAAHHRHHAPNQWWHFGIGVWSRAAGRLVGVAIVGIPSARMIDPRRVCEVTRCCTDGTRNACSFLYARCAVVAEALGFQAIITYTLAEEDGASMRALGWWGEVAASSGGHWDVPSRARRRDLRGVGLGVKVRWLKLLGDFTSQPQVATVVAENNLELPLGAVALKSESV